MSRTRRQKVAMTGGLQCHYCGFLTWLTPKDKAAVEASFPAAIAPGRHRKRALQYRMHTVDHVLSQARGGGHSRGNMVTACFLCNGMKADAPEHQFQALMAYMLKKEVHPHQLFQRTGIWFAPEFIPVKSIKAKKEKTDDEDV